MSVDRMRTIQPKLLLHNPTVFTVRILRSTSVALVCMSRTVSLVTILNYSKAVMTAEGSPLNGLATEKSGA